MNAAYSTISLNLFAEWLHQLWNILFYVGCGGNCAIILQLKQKVGTVWIKNLMHFINAHKKHISLHDWNSATHTTWLDNIYMPNLETVPLFISKMIKDAL